MRGPLYKYMQPRAFLKRRRGEQELPTKAGRHLPEITSSCTSPATPGWHQKRLVEMKPSSSWKTQAVLAYERGRSKWTRSTLEDAVGTNNEATLTFDAAVETATVKLNSSCRMSGDLSRECPHLRGIQAAGGG